MGSDERTHEQMATLPALDGSASLDRDSHFPSDLKPGTSIGRYLVLARLGAGGMGVVYAAHDPDLDRKIALKLLQPGLGNSSTGRARLLREAQALAKLSHPHVVTVHDVGTHQGRVWLAMKFIDGLHLGKWLEARERSVSEVLAVFEQVGRGVMAAHRAGLLHRDLKPENIMIDAHGHAWVMDFGLARSQEVREDSSGPHVAPLVDGSTLSVSLTEHGALLGTPAYMAPEQFLGEEVGPRSDQFSLCITLWEALYGERPFRGETVEELSLAVTNGEREPPPRGARVPAWLGRICERGLALDPELRWPSVEALLEAIARGRRLVRLRWGALGLAVLLAGAAGVYGVERVQQRQRIAACAQVGASIDEVWNDAARETLHEALVATRVLDAEQTALLTTPWLDRWAAAWRRARSDACTKAEVEQSWDAQTYERARWCLEVGRMPFDAIVETLSRAEPNVVPRAVSMASGLRSIDPCIDAALLERLPLPPEAQRERTRSVRIELSRADALGRAGRYDAGMERIEPLSASVESEVGWPPLTALVFLRHGELLQDSGRYAEAETVLADACFEAIRVEAHETAATAAVMLTQLVGRRLARPAEGKLWARLAEVSLSTYAEPGELRWGPYYGALGSVYQREGALDRALELYERQLALEEQGLGASHPGLANALNNVAVVHAEAGRYREARALFERIVAIREQSLGASHPQVAAAINNLANVLRELGDYEEAKRRHQRALSLKQQRLGPRHPDVATSLQNLALVHQSMGELDEAQAMLERSIAIFEETLGPEHPVVAENLINLALVHEDREQHEQAESLLLRALAIHEKVLGPEHAAVAHVLNNLSLIRLAMHDPVGAEQGLQRARAILEAEYGPQHPDLAHPLVGLALTALEQDRGAEAVARAKQALALREAAGIAPPLVADARAVLAEALAATGDTAGARAAAEQARAAYREASPAKARELSELEELMATLPAAP